MPEDRPATICVTGASGWIGRRVCRELRLQARVTVVEIGRRRAPAPSGQAFVEADLSAALDDNRALREALTGAVALVHCAGYAHRPRETAAERTRLFRVNRDGTERLVRLAEALGVQRFVHVSTIAFYDWSQPQPVEETGLVRPATAYARSKLEAEQVVRESRLDWRVARLATVFGVDDRANLFRMARALRAGCFAMPQPGDARKSVIPVELAARCLAQLAQTDRTPHRVVHLALPHAPSLAEIAESFGRVCGLPRPWSLPERPLRIAGRAADALARWGVPCPLTTETLSKLTTSTVVAVRRMTEAFPDVEWPTFEAALAVHRRWYSEAV